MCLIENIEYSEEWLLKEIIKTDFEQKKTKTVLVVSMTKIDLLKMFQQFIKLNKRGG